MQVEAVGAAQAEHIAALLGRACGSGRTVLRRCARVAPVHRCSPPRRPRVAAHFPRSSAPPEGAPFVLDLVSDGPHAIVVGVTGAGKSALLVCGSSRSARPRPGRGERPAHRFQGRHGVPPARHPSARSWGVLTDLDPDAARRAITSLRAEAPLAGGGPGGSGVRARVAEAGIAMPRLVIVSTSSPRSANSTPSFWRSSPTSRPREGARPASRARIAACRRRHPRDAHGQLPAADLPACHRSGPTVRPSWERTRRRRCRGPGRARGWALVRRGSDARAVACASPARPGRIWSVHVPRAHPPSAAPLGPAASGERALADLSGPAGERAASCWASPTSPNGNATPRDPGRARARFLVLGTAGAGKSNVLAVIAAQTRGRVHVLGPDLERAWDAVSELAARGPPGAARPSWETTSTGSRALSPPTTPMASSRRSSS